MMLPKFATRFRDLLRAAGRADRLLNSCALIELLGVEKLYDGSCGRSMLLAAEGEAGTGSRYANLEFVGTTTRRF
jgi:hypothetical protein